jgi:hypothetical protein
MDHRSELDRWLTAERIARSELMQVVFEGVRSGTWDASGAEEVLLAALRGFGNGCCYFLASAVVGVRGGTIAGFWRVRGDDRLVHAVVVDPADGHASDIVGRRPLAAVRSELVEAVGDVAMSVLPPIGDGMDEAESEILSGIAAALPWMRMGIVPPAPADWGRLVMDYVSARASVQGR